MKITNFTPILLQYNDYNGFTFELFRIDAETDKTSFIGSLLGLDIQRRVYMDLCFFRFEIKSPFSW